MTEWIIPGNPTKYDVIGAFQEFKVINWKQTLNFEVGDIVYIYLSANIKAIRYQCRVNKINMPNITIDDSKYNISGEFDGKYGRYIELELLQELHGDCYTKQNLDKYGFVSPQRGIKLIPILKEYLDSCIQGVSLNSSIDMNKLQPILNAYKRDFNKNWPDESYKWEAVQHFQEHWDIDADDFDAMLKEATTKAGNLLTGLNFFPLGMLSDLIGHDTNAVRQMFKNLYDENVDLSQRVDAFKNKAQELFDKYKGIHIQKGDKWGQHYQSTNSISTYLWLRYPDKYYIYKYTIACNVAEALNPDVKPKGDGSASEMATIYALYDAIADELAKDNDLQMMLADKVNANNDLYKDPTMRTLTVDFGHYLSNLYLKNKINIWKISQGEKFFSSELNKKLADRNVVSLHEDTAALKGSKHTQFEYFEGMVEDGAKPGDYFYLCYSGSIQLLGRFNTDYIEPNPDMDDGWMERGYELIAISKDTVKYTGKQKKWTSNFLSTFVKVPENDLFMFQNMILEPYFGLRISDLLDGQTPNTSIKTNTDVPVKPFALPSTFQTPFSRRTITSLLAKPFVILTGNSGTGKTRIAKQFAQYLQVLDKAGNPNWALVPVGADWTDNTKVLGFYNPLGNDGAGKYEKTEVLQLIERANANSTVPYFLILDEMNLSHVERYFADFLSHMETMDQPFILDGYTNEEDGTNKIAYPQNLFVVGTVNIDETTYMFSPKVLDRANVVEFVPEKDSILSLFDTPVMDNETAMAEPGVAQGFLQLAQRIRGGIIADAMQEQMGEGKPVYNIFSDVYDATKECGFDFAYRTVREIRQYIAAAYEIAGDKDQFEIKTAIDEQLLQKVLPKIHGNNKQIGDLLKKLDKICEEHALTESSKKINSMKQRLDKVQYASFI